MYRLIQLTGVLIQEGHNVLFVELIVQKKKVSLERVVTLFNFIRLIIKECIVGGVLIKKSLVLILMSSLFIMSACTGAKTQSLEEFYKDAKIGNIDKVIIQDGSTGASKEITEQEQIDEFLSLTKDIKFIPQDNQEKRVGWRYSITLFDNKRAFKFTLNNIENTYYDTTPDIHPIVDNYYKQLEIEEK